MGLEYSHQSDLEVLRLAEQERGKAVAGFVHWLFSKPEVKSPDHSADIAAAE